MINGIYTSTAGMLVQKRENETIANNIANANTTGFKRRMAVFFEKPDVNVHKLEKGEETEFYPYLSDEMIGKTGQGVIVSRIHTDYQQGSLKQTGNKFDFAVVGKGYFPVQTPDNKVMFTRSGDFTLNNEGYLVTQQGYKVLASDSTNLPDDYEAFSQAGEPFVALNPVKFSKEDNDKIEFMENGSIMINGEESGKSLKVYKLSDKAIPMGSNLFSQGAGDVKYDAQSKIQSGFLEASNVNSVKEMVRMIEALRAYESGDRLIRAQDDSLSKLIARMSNK